ncbi:MAG: ABC transporter ATP-binding protein [Gemmataceae bacterium]
MIHLQHIHHYYGTFPALQDVSLQLEAGRIGLLGPNGAGKSTLLKILMGLITPTSGSGWVLDRRLGQDGLALRRAIGYMPEADALVPGLGGAEYVALAGQLYGMPRRQALRRAHEVLTYLGLEEARYRKLEEYSTGMKQRLKLAQALVHDPELLLLDEPTSGLDPAGREGMLDLLHTLGKDYNKSLILSTHLLGDVERVCETVVILHQGHVLLQGGVAALRTRRHDRYCLQVQGETGGFIEDLRLEGIHIMRDNGQGELRLAVPPGWSPRGFFVLADHHGLILRGLRRDDENLEELFHRVITEKNAAATRRG